MNNTQVILGHSTFTGRLFRFSNHSENYKNLLSGQSNFLQKMTEDRFVTYLTSKENNHVEKKGTVGAVVASFLLTRKFIWITSFIINL